jgi:glutamyl-tRNA synthetase
MIELFSLEGVNPANPIFDKEKLEWMNGEYIRAYDNEKLLDLIVPFLIQQNLITPKMANEKKAWLLKFVSLLKERCRTLKEFAEKGRYFFAFDYQYEPTAASKHFNSAESAKTLDIFVDRLSKLDSFEKQKVEEALRNLATDMGTKPAPLIHMVRLATTGTTAGPGLFDILEFLGKEEVVKRIKKAIEFIQAKFS